jgi:hypothetical protein
MIYPHNLDAQHFAHQANMIGQANAVIGREMDSRRLQAREQADRNHEYQMETLRQQGRQKAQQQEAPPQQESPTQLDQVRKARNRSLMAKAGLGGRTIKSGPNGVKVTPHPYGDNPFASALLGD